MEPYSIHIQCTVLKMKCIILLSLFALCYSIPYGWGSGRNISVNPDGSIKITSAGGKSFTYFKGIGPYSSGFGAGYQSYGYPPYQTEALVQLLQKYQGDISPYTYQQLLEEVREAVQAGQVSGDVYETLQGLNQYGRGYYGPSQLWQSLQYGQQGKYQQYPGAYVYSPQYSSYLRGFGYPSGVSSYSPFFSRLFSGSGYGYGQYPSGVSSSYSPFFSKLFGRSGYGYGQYGQYGQVQPVIGQLSQVIQGERQILGEQDQIQQEQIQQQLQQQQLIQQQQYLGGLQQEIKQEEEQVLGEQERLQGYGGFRNYLSGGRLGSWSPNFWQQYYGVYPFGRSYYGGYGQGFQRPSTAWVY